MDKQRDVYTMREIKSRYKIGEKTLYRLARDGILETIKFGCAVRFYLLEDEDGNPIEELYTVKEIADKYKVHTQTVYNQIGTGQIKSVRIGNLIRVID